ncbi:Methyl-accepting chemotaxis protein [Pseudomonas syringae pv. cilantro]|uniref:Methyl-accepting chemotaxis protein n=4 Tax=Pseudomonas TaxID=286 RepID=A0A0N0GCU0_PSESX|nr:MULTISPECIES: methyl-accepting chemotaxis protein [Pseudomonas syringae group]KPC24706.1 Methyl-accepting chemotaxis protein [Pseudomonas syringae pv. cilantro]KPW74380.1 Methyl-accepting chemotaxis protein [Pseudomonas syringae pv. coriandricola]RMN14546.1 Histidine kinase, HAMP region: chemotaxis sensory transducer [Pseudomonas syringae pv. coriandricola]
MSRGLSRSLANASVSLKLAVGFGLVLAMTLMISATAWFSNQALIDRGDRVTAIAEINELTLQLRIDRMRYEDLYDTETAATVRTTLDQLDAALLVARNLLRSPENIQLLDRQIQTTREYRQSFKDMTDAIDTREASRTRMGANADKAVDQADKVEAELLKADNILAFNRIVGVSKLIQQARFQVRGYTYSGRPDFEKNANQAIDDAVTGINTLTSDLAAEYQALLQQAVAGLKGYREAMGQYRDAQAASKAALDRMTAEGADMLAISNDMITRQNKSRDADSEQSVMMIAVATLLALVLSIMAAWIITRQITTPLKETLEVVERVASGDLSRNLQVDRKDELGKLQSTIQRMTVSLRELVGGIRDGVTQIASAAEELSAVTEQTSAGVNSQKVETDQVATAMHEMTATVQEVARNAEEASEAAVAADQQARDGERVVNEAIAQIERLAVAVGNSSEAMGALKQESEKIGSVLDVIKSVAQQTNLLALNAAIEAARAGEAGRGFAVVADEVRSLAQRTQKSTEEIEALIASLQSGTQQAATVMDSSRELSGSSVELTRRAGSSLENITKTVSAIQSMNQQIAAAAEQQSATAEEINRSIINVRDISEQTSSASEETAASSVELARLGNHLQILVSRFTV